MSTIIKVGLNFILLELAILGLLHEIHGQIADHSTEFPEKRPLKLKDILPEDYDSLVPPKYQGQPTYVRVRIWLLDIRAMNDRDMTFTSDLYIQQYWEDRRLIFPKWVSESRVIINTEWRESLWYPDIFILNAVEAQVDTFLRPSLYMWVYRNTSIMFSGRFSVKTSCDMDLHNFPHDTQSCNILFTSMSYTINDMVLKWIQDERGGFKLSQRIVLPQFQMLNLNASEGTKKLSGGTNSYLEAQMKFKRREGYYIINVYVPTVLIVSMSMLTFWIPPDAVPARVTLGVTSLLTMITKQYQAEMPTVSYIVAMNVWLSCCIGFVFGSLLEYSIVIVLLAKFKQETGSEDNRGSARNRHKIHGKVRCVNTNGMWQKTYNVKEKSKMSKLPYIIDYVSRVLFPAIFISITIAYWYIYTNV